MQSDVKAERTSLSRACGQGMEGLPNAWCSRRRTEGQAEWKLPARRSNEGRHQCCTPYQFTGKVGATEYVNRWRSGGSLGYARQP
jgi:hypothetical protein